jgi:predicted dehydrogenase
VAADPFELVVVDPVRRVADDGGRLLRWGLLGTARITQNALAPAMRKAGHDLAVVGSRSLPRARAFAASNGVRRGCGSYEEVVTADDVDAVYVALPNDAHEEWTIAALRAGKHVLCEKPLSTDAASAGRMAAAAVTSGRVLMEAVMTRFHPRTVALLELVHSGELGSLRLLHATFAFPMRRPGDYRSHPQRGGGALLDVGIYGVAMARWLVSEEPDGVQAVTRRWATGVDGTTSALLSFPGGAVASIDASFDTAQQQALQLVGTEGTLRVPSPFGASPDVDAVILRGDEVVGSWRADHYERMVSAFADAAATGSTAPLPADDAVATATVLDAIRKAAG